MPKTGVILAAGGEAVTQDMEDAKNKPQAG